MPICSDVTIAESFRIDDAQSPARKPNHQVVPLDLLGELGIIRMAISNEDTTVLVNASIMLQESGAFRQVAGRDTAIIDKNPGTLDISCYISGKELDFSISPIRPHYLLPIHGEYRSLARCVRSAMAVAGSGNVVLLSADGDKSCFESLCIGGESDSSGRFLTVTHMIMGV